MVPRISLKEMKQILIVRVRRIGVCPHRLPTFASIQNKANFPFPPILATLLAFEWQATGLHFW